VTGCAYSQAPPGGCEDHARGCGCLQVYPPAACLGCCYSTRGAPFAVAFRGAPRVTSGKWGGPCLAGLRHWCGSGHACKPSSSDWAGEERSAKVEDDGVAPPEPTDADADAWHRTARLCSDPTISKTLLALPTLLLTHPFHSHHNNQLTTITYSHVLRIHRSTQLRGRRSQAQPGVARG
jgi:hypothetical protein